MSHTAFYDLAIIGGGIVGVGIAAEAATRGLSVCLIEKKDFGSATSSASSKLIHGGLRYLEHWEFGLVREALTEQRILLERAPHLVKKLAFYMPYQTHHRPKWMIKSGLFLYDHLTKRHLPSSQFLTFDTTHPEHNPLQSSYREGFLYYDAQTNDSRLVIVNALLAKQYGAHLFNYQTCIGFKRLDNYWAIQCKTKTGNPISYHARCLVHATGPWMSVLQPDVQLRLVQGSHIVVPKQYQGNYAFLLQHTDNRIIFVTPYHQHWTMIGTTEVPFTGNLDNVAISDQEMVYLLTLYNHYFKITLKKEDICSHWSGIRPMLIEANKSPSANTRKHRIIIQTNPQNQLPLLSVYGGKLTTYRAIAEDCLQQLQPFLPRMTASITKHCPLPGADWIDKATYSWLPTVLFERYQILYGSLLSDMLADCHCLQDLGKEIVPGLYEKEIQYLKEQEWAVTAEDILWRRTALGLEINEEEEIALKKYLGEF